MIDFWEAFGRLATDDDLRKALYQKFPVGPYNFDKTRRGISIPKKNYYDARDLIAQVIPRHPISIMGLGEVLLCISTRIFRDGFKEVVDAIKKTKVPTYDRSSLFYTALGLMLVDGSVLLQFRQGGTYFNKYQFGDLGPRERRDISLLAKDKVVAYWALKVCQIYWSEGCYSKYLHWQPSLVYPHLHPVATSYPPSLNTLKALKKILKKKLKQK